MNVLIVEDDDEKAKSIRTFIDEYFMTTSIQVSRSLQTGLHTALSGEHDLILLDMTMTNYERTIHEDGGRPHHFAGREILRQLLREEIHVPVIVVTQFGRFGEESEEVTLSELQADLTGRFPDYLGTVHYRSNVDEWKRQLSDLIGNILVRK